VKGIDFYYLVKPLIPRTVQIALRRRLVQRRRAACASVWPIDEGAGTVPHGWTGWPGGKRFALVLTHDIESAQGIGRCSSLARIEERLGFRSSFNFVPERYATPPELRRDLAGRGFEIGVHGLCHDGKLYRSSEVFRERADRINGYLREWNAVGFRSPAMHHNLEWLCALAIRYDSSTFDTDPFEPQADGVRTIFPFRVPDSEWGPGYVEMPYTLAQDSTLFLLMRETGIGVWRTKLDWIADRGGMALLNTHPDYMRWEAGARPGAGGYPVGYYEEFLAYAAERYGGEYWHGRPREAASCVVAGEPA